MIDLCETHMRTEEFLSEFLEFLKETKQFNFNFSQFFNKKEELQKKLKKNKMDDQNFILTHSLEIFSLMSLIQFFFIQYQINFILINKIDDNLEKRADMSPVHFPYNWANFLGLSKKTIFWTPREILNLLTHKTLIDPTLWNMQLLINDFTKKYQYKENLPGYDEFRSTPTEYPDGTKATTVQLSCIRPILEKTLPSIQH